MVAREEKPPPLEVAARPRFVSRGGDKLDFALGALGIEVAGRVCLDVGASTGGRHPMDATGVYMAVWTGIVSVLFGIMAVWLMIVEARVRRREALKAAGGAHPTGRPPRRHAGKP